MRVSDYVQIAHREITRQRIRSGLTVLALAISTIILVALAAISLGGRQAITTQLAPDESLTSVIVTSARTTGNLSLFGSVQEANEASAKLDDTSAQQLLAIAGVKHVSPRVHLWELQTFTISGSTKTFVAQAQGTSVGPEDIKISSGSTFSTPTAREVILGKAYLKDLGLTADQVIGKQITLTTQKGYRGDGAVIPGPRATQKQYDDFNQKQTRLTATVTGITTAGNDENKLLLPMEWARQIRTTQISITEKKDALNENGYSSIVVTVASPAAVKAVSTAIDNLGYGHISTQAIVEKLTQFSSIMWFILGAVALVALLAASLGIVNTMLMTVSEQRYVIGVWRAVGARRSTIAAIFLIQAGFLGFVGGIIGAVAGWYASTLVNERIADILQAQNLPPVNIAAAPIWLCAGSVILATIFAIVAGLYPAWRAARQDPSKILHSI